LFTPEQAARPDYSRPAPFFHPQEQRLQSLHPSRFDQVQIEAGFPRAPSVLGLAETRERDERPRPGRNP
jgi:hypothetical protein